MSRYLQIALFILFIGCWFLNYPVLVGKFDLESCSQQYRFWTIRFTLFEAMLLTLVIICFLNTKGLLKALSAFLLVVIGASVIDKAVFNISTYLCSDVLIVGLALLTAYLIYKRNGNK